MPSGYLFNIGGKAGREAIQSYVDAGVYGTFMSQPSGHWSPQAEATLGDYVTMRPGDNVYFFSKRLVFGIGKLVEVGPDCRYQNYLGASRPERFDYDADALLFDAGPESMSQRWVCTFVPDPHFFARGLDMDDLLTSRPDAFRMLRVNWKRSFIKFDDDENQAFRDALLSANADVIASPRFAEPGSPDDLIEDAASPPNVMTSRLDAHERIHSMATGGFDLDVGAVLSACASGTELRHEMALEVGLLDQLHREEPDTIAVFGRWDHLAHQVIASPTKPADYADWMDIFGQRYVPGHAPTIERYLVIENKRSVANKADIDQVMNYVDWVTAEYAHGDYSKVEGYLVAHSIPDEVRARAGRYAKRGFTRGRRPPESMEWDDLKLVEYAYDEAARKLTFMTLASD